MQVSVTDERINKCMVMWLIVVTTKAEKLSTSFIRIYQESSVTHGYSMTIKVQWTGLSLQNIYEILKSWVRRWMCIAMQARHQQTCNGCLKKSGYCINPQG